MQTFLSFFSLPLLFWSLAIAGVIFVCYLVFLRDAYRVEKKKPQRKFAVLVEYLVESIYNFFEEILGEKAPFWIKSYVTNLFLIILIANVIGLLLDILISPFPVLEQYIQNPTGDISFTLALAVCSIFIVLRVEAKTKGLGSFLYSYFPVWGTDLFKLSKKSESVWMFYLIRPFAKVFDIVISLFIGILNIIGIIAKVISLAFRLYGNMMAGSLLLMIIVWMLGEATKGRLAGLELPLLVPLIFYLQSTLTAVVQALVFSLLTSVFIKMSLDTESKNSKVENEELIVKQLAESIQRKTL